MNKALVLTANWSELEGQLQAWLDEHPDIEVVAMSQSEDDDSCIVLTLIYRTRSKEW